VSVVLLWDVLLTLFIKRVLCLVLLNTSVKVTLYALSAVSQNFIQLFPTAVESFKHFLCNFTNGLVNPNKFSKLRILKVFLFLELIDNDGDPLAYGIICINQHATEHVI
jgi:hypothetical protein